MDTDFCLIGSHQLCYINQFILYILLDIVYNKILTIFQKLIMPSWYFYYFLLFLIITRSSFLRWDWTLIL